MITDDLAERYRQAHKHELPNYRDGFEDAKKSMVKWSVFIGAISFGWGVLIGMVIK